ncbi:hypothetical protein [Thermocoleostomius sinensis]|uniref:Uncharacterized protein n=1 Tax=Thermocoleostomius sinensis A174 TaxID=2016057 RepID=A0A9E8Z845_9CYAN|nr:hypothetical protein [Thermocoleostomius sinensis]WAL58056.1 hypothetical protein OXH18_12700 [Thermocoleostomius sinensis A174]
MAQSTVRVTQSDGDLVELPTVLDQFEDVYFTRDRNFYQNQRFPRMLAPFFGVVERDIARDGRRINHLYREVLEQQINSTDLIRVADLPSPFTGSLATTPLYLEEPIPPAPIPRFAPPPVPVPPIPRSAPTTPERPVPALW